MDGRRNPSPKWLPLLAIPLVGTLAWAQAPIKRPDGTPMTSPASKPAEEAAASEPRAITTRQRSFPIPVTIDAGAGANPKEVQLLTSTDGGRRWKIHTRQAPDQPAFQFQAEADGEYCFASRTIDEQGRPNPARDVKPELRIVIDSTKPTVELSAEVSPDNKVKVVWKAQDANIRADGVRLEYQTGEPQRPIWRTIPLAPADVRRGPDWFAGETAFHPETTTRVVNVRLVVRDGAGNTASSMADAYLKKEGAPAGTAGPQFAPTTGRVANDVSTDESPGEPFVRRRETATEVAEEPAGDSEEGATGVAESTPWPVDNEPAPATAPPPLAPPKPPRPYTTVAKPKLRRDEAESAPEAEIAYPSTLHPSDALGGETPAPSPRTKPTFGPTPSRFASQPLPESPEETAAEHDEEESDAVSESADPALGPGERPRLVNDRHINLDYDLDGVGPAGVKSVQLWGTKDGGRTWDKWGEDDDKTSPFEIQVESESTFGFRMVVASNNGLEGKPPKSGEPADVWITVDRTAPQVQLQQASYGQGEHAGKLDIRWEADDAHMGGRPIALQFSEKADGPWTTIAAGLPNSGSHMWAVDSRTPRKLYLKIECRDEAGNVSSDTTSEPISLEGLTPRGRIKGTLQPARGPSNSGASSAPGDSRSAGAKDKSNAFRKPLFE